jgi:Predicted S-adenosylmethionine-dependent methyltransferase involved in cell envelope biogenesis
LVEHYSVLHQEVLEFSKLIAGGIFVDATVGGGGHSYLILKQNPNLKLIGLDKDDFALKVAKERLKEFKDRITLVKSSFKDLDKVLQSLQIKEINGILFDFGVSTFQLKLERGFLFKEKSF